MVQFDSTKKSFDITQTIQDDTIVVDINLKDNWKKIGTLSIPSLSGTNIVQSFNYNWKDKSYYYIEVNQIWYPSQINVSGTPKTKIHFQYLVNTNTIPFIYSFNVRTQRGGTPLVTYGDINIQPSFISILNEKGTTNDPDILMGYDIYEFDPTATYVEPIPYDEPYYTKAETDALLLPKQDKVDNTINDPSHTVVTAINNNQGAITLLSADVDNINNQIPALENQIQGLSNNKEALLNGSTYIELQGTPALPRTINLKKDDLRNQINTVDTYTTLTTSVKTIVGGINELVTNVVQNDDDITDLNEQLSNKADKEVWLSKGTSTNARTWTYNILPNKKYKVYYSWGSNSSSMLEKTFTTNSSVGSSVLDDYVQNVVLLGIGLVKLQLNQNSTNITITDVGNATGGYIFDLKELQ